VAVSINGATKIITLETLVPSIEAYEIYSDWKDWVLLSDKAKWTAGFRVIGGDSVGSGITAGSYCFLQNQDGWRIKPPEESIQITISGNIYPEDVGAVMFAGTTGSYNTLINLQTSSLTQTVATAGSTPADVATAVRSNLATELAAITKTKKYTSNRLVVTDGAYTVYDDDGTTPYETGSTNNPDGNRTPD